MEEDAMTELHPARLPLSRGETVSSKPDVKPVVVGVDHSESARHAALWAADLAVNQRRPLQLVHSEPDMPADGSREAPDWLRALLDDATRGGAATQSRIVRGEPIEQLVSVSADAHLLVVGSYGSGARAGMLAGDAALGLVEGAHCPVAVIRGAEPGVAPRPHGPVVVGVDGSAAGDIALELAAELARSLGARLLAVHTWSDVEADPTGAPHYANADRAALADRAAQLHDAHVIPVRQRHPDLQVGQETVLDTPLRALLARASDARAIVVGHRASPPPQQSVLVLGSTSRGLVGFAPCPVVVAHGPRPDRAGSEAGPGPA
jgi:nucleotide-binding universal stress UspA family protein